MQTLIPLVNPASRLTPRSISWLWPNRLARGKLSFFDGDPEVGKSLITLDLCARITTGRPFPDGASGAEPASVIILNGEDEPEDTIAPRLHALGADLNRAFVFSKEFLDQSGHSASLPTPAYWKAPWLKPALPCWSWTPSWLFSTHPSRSSAT